MISRRRFLAASVVLSAIRVPVHKGLDRDTTPRLADVRTGYIALDDLTGGFYPGTLTVIAGPSAGQLAADVATYVGIDDLRPVLYLAMDETRETILTRMACVEAGWMKGLSEEARLKRAEQAVGAAPIYVQKTDLASIQAIVRKSRRDLGIQLVIVDGQETQALRKLKALAVELNLPVNLVMSACLPEDLMAVADGVWLVQPVGRAHEAIVVWNQGNRTGRIELRNILN